jgi:hypothetical protein
MARSPCTSGTSRREADDRPRTSIPTGPRPSGCLRAEAEFELDGQMTRAAAGGFVLVPGGAAHTFGATPAAGARLLVLHAPALDDYFRELARLWSAQDPPALDEELDLMRRHGMRPV